MGPSASISEITESDKELCSGSRSKVPALSKLKLSDDVGVKHSNTVQNDLLRLFEALDIKAPSRPFGYCKQGLDPMQKNFRSKTAGVNAASGVGASQSADMKQALRRMCISQASETAAMKRLSKLSLSGISQVRTIERLYAAVVVQSCEINEKETANVLEVSIPEKKITQTSKKEISASAVSSIEPSNKSHIRMPRNTTGSVKKTGKLKVRDTVAVSAAKTGCKISAHSKSRTKGKVRYGPSSLRTVRNCEANKCSTTPQVKPVFKNKCSSRLKEKYNHSSPASSSMLSNHSDGVEAVIEEHNQESKEGPAQESKLGDANTLSCSKGDVIASKRECTPTMRNGGRVLGTRTRKSPRSRIKGEYSQSSKSSLGDFSSSTSISFESNQSGSSGFGSRPHMSKDVRWIAIHSSEREHGAIGLKNFALLKRLGCGDIGTVYLAELTGSECLFALKIMDNEYLMSRKKMLRAETEREILQMLDHPFLPTLYTHFISDNLSCLVMEYCPGGDLHVLRQQQPGRCFPEPAARFYVAEVLLALEYLHMLGVIYRDLKPENILVREDGHIMLSDFDLSLRCSVNPTLLRSCSLAEVEAANRLQGPCAVSSCIDPLCIQPSCFKTHLTSNSKDKSTTQRTPLPQLVAEPTEARSNSFVGTHEYLAPEIIKGEGHGSSVDWWTFGIFLYELLFGRTPFKGPGNEETLTNIVCESLMFPECPNVSFQAIDLIRGLLAKEPEHRLGSVKGAAEIKQHPFFRGLNWALIRCTIPPEVPVPLNANIHGEEPLSKDPKSLQFGAFKASMDFEMF